MTAGHYDLFCGIPGASFGDVSVKDSFVQSSLSDDIEIPGPCSNARFINDIVASAGAAFNPLAKITGDGIFFSATEADIEGGVIEGSEGVGLHLQGAQRVSVTGMHIQGNGVGNNGDAGIEIDGSHTISICGNHLEGNGGDVPNSAHIYFKGTPDNINLCGNVYEPQPTTDVTFRPLYAYDANSGASVTNLHLYDSPAPQASGQVYSTNAAAILPQLQVPQVPQNVLSGLTLLNATSPPNQVVNIKTGEATDSTNSVVIQRTTSCTVNLGHSGLGGLDLASPGVMPHTTYFYFLVASPSGGNANCMASASTVPNLQSANFTITPTGETQTGVPYLYNLTSIAGLAPGQPIATNSYLSTGTTISTASNAVGTLTVRQLGNFTSSTVINFPSGIANVGQDMTISDNVQIAGSTCAPASAIPAPNGQPDTIASVSFSSNTITLQNGITGTLPSNDCITISGGYAVALSSGAAATTTSGPVTFTIYGGVYALIAALYTDSSSNVVGFTQDGNTFYLNQAVTDIETGGLFICASSIGSTAQPCQLSVPCGRLLVACAAPGLKVLAFGRLVGGTGNEILLSSYDQTNIQPPNNFIGPPGFSTKDSGTSTAFPFRLHTDGNGNVRVQANAGSNTVYEATDGWVFDRSLQ